MTEKEASTVVRPMSTRTRRGLGLAVAFLLVVFGAAVFFRWWPTPTPEPPVTTTVPLPATPTPPKPKERKWGIATAPAGLPATGAKRGWEDVLEAALESMKSVAEYSRESSYRPSTMAADGLLQQSEDGLLTMLKKPFLTIFASDLGLTFYQWALPAVKAAFSAMPQEDRDDYLRIVAYASGLLGRYSDHYQYELKYWEWLEKDGCYVWGKEQRESASFPPCTDLFARLGPGGKPNPYRKLEAFIFRRFHFDGIEPQWMKYWVDRVWYDLTH